jgi:hypothetical protein
MTAWPRRRHDHGAQCRQRSGRRRLSGSAASRFTAIHTVNCRTLEPWQRRRTTVRSLDDLLDLDRRARDAAQPGMPRSLARDHHRSCVPAHAGRADRRARVRPLPRGRGLRRQGAALLGRLRSCAVAPPAAPDATEFVVCALPLGGYVRMLDEREAPVEPHELDRAFNRKPLWARTAIVSAGPLANLALAVLLYASAHWIGVVEPKAVLSTPASGSLMEAAGLKAATGCARGRPTAGLAGRAFADRPALADHAGRAARRRAAPDGQRPRRPRPARDAHRTGQAGCARGRCRDDEGHRPGAGLQRTGDGRGQGRRPGAARPGCARATACWPSTAPVSTTPSACAIAS